MKVLKITLVSILVILIEILGLKRLAASIVVPNDTGYYQFSHKDFNLIFHKNDKKYVRPMANYIFHMRQEFVRSYKYTLDEKPVYILTSSKNQIPNAFATVLPSTTSSYFRGLGVYSSEFASKNLMAQVISHEMSHLYQLTPKHGFAKFTYNIFGNHLFFVYPLIPIWVFVHPGNVIPTWILEGNAVLNESRFGNGGRLHSGKSRAMFYVLLKEKLLDENRLTNNHLEFPYGEEKYLIGGYFNLFLAEKYGVDKVNNFFWEQGYRYFNPFLLNKSFRNHFGKSYSDLVRKFIKFYGRKARKIKTTPSSKILASSIYSLPLNSNKKYIYFLSLLDGKQYPYLYRLEKSTLKLKRVKKDLKAGKPFRVKNKFYTVASNRGFGNEILFGLWDEKENLLKESRSKIIQDIKNNKMLYIDVPKSFVAPHLYLDGKFINKVHSEALMDDQNNIFYFRQEEKNRVLYKNKMKLISFEGYFSKLVDIDSKGNVYFIGNTKYGESLFYYDHYLKKIFRCTSSDLIDEAKLINDSKFLVVELTSKKYQYKIIEAEKKEETPYSYMILPEEKNSISFSEDKMNSSKLPGKYSSYNSLLGMKFNYWSMSFLASGDDYSAAAIFSFSDPMQYNNFSLISSLEENNSQKYSFVYLNKMYMINWFISPKYFNISENFYHRNHYTVEFGITSNVINSRRWKLTPTLSFIYNPTYRTPWEYLVSIGAAKTVSFPLSYIPYQFMAFKGEFLNNEKGNKYHNVLRGSYDIGNENIFSSELTYDFSDTGYLNWGESLKENKEYFIPTYHHEYWHTDNLSLGRLGISYEKVINKGVYSEVIPLSMRRFAPKVFGSYKTVSFAGHRNESEVEYGFGIKSELLIGHISTFNLNVNIINNISKKNKEFFFFVEYTE